MKRSEYLYMIIIVSTRNSMGLGDIRFGCSSSPGKEIQKSCQAQSGYRWLPSMLHAAEPYQYESIPVRGSSRCRPSPLGLGTGRPRSIGPRGVRIDTDGLAARLDSLNSIRSHRAIPLGPWAEHRYPHILGILAKEATKGEREKTYRIQRSI